MDKMSRIFVAGHTGLIGSAVMRALERDGFVNIIKSLHSDLDLNEQAAVDHFFDSRRPEYVVLAAGRVGGIIENQTYPADFINTNLAIQLNVLRAACRARVRKLLLFGSSCMYPRECVQPMSETALFSGHLEPTSISYAVSKLAGIQMCLAYNQQYGLGRFIPIIPNTVFGPRDSFDPRSSHVLSALIQRFHEAKQQKALSVMLWGTGNPRREFIHADDVAEASLLLLKTDTSKLQFPMNLGTGCDFTISELAKLVADVVGYSGEIKWDTSKPDGAPRKLLDCGRMYALGWQAKIDLLEGLKSTYEWYLNVKCISKK
jgi:GDP-L-fucose synthase